MATALKDHGDGVSTAHREAMVQKAQDGVGAPMAPQDLAGDPMRPDKDGLQAGSAAVPGLQHG